MESVSSLGRTFICRKSSMNMTINNRYCNRFIHVGRLIFSVNRSGASVYNPDDIWECAYAVLHSRGTAHPICDPSRIISACCRALNSSMLWLFREAITCPIIVFTSSPTCFAGTNAIAIDLMTAKDRFFFSIMLWSGDCAMTSLPCAPENMSHENIRYNWFLHLDVI